MICVFYLEKFLAYLPLSFFGALQKNQEKGALDLQGTVCLILHGENFRNIILLILVSFCVLNALLNKTTDWYSMKLCIYYCKICEIFVSLINIFWFICFNVEKLGPFKNFCKIYLTIYLKILLGLRFSQVMLFDWFYFITIGFQQSSCLKSWVGCTYCHCYKKSKSCMTFWVCF